MWFIPALLCLFMWSGSDLFSKIGCTDRKDRYAPLKMIITVGAVMGLHAFYTLFIEKIPFSFEMLVRYLPVSFLYIISMAIGYFGLRYIELSISSPICNSSGAVVLLIYLLRGEMPTSGEWFGLVLIIFGVVYLGFVEYREDPEIRQLRQEAANWQYEKSLLAILLPIVYMLLDAAGTYLDSLVLESMDEKAANTAYELTFFLVAWGVFFYLLYTKKLKLEKKEDAAKVLAAIFETAGQFAYVFALAANPMYAAPMISAYCVLSVVWSRVFLKEKLSKRHYLAIAATVIGIMVLGILEGKAEA